MKMEEANVVRSQCAMKRREIFVPLKYAIGLLLHFGLHGALKSLVFFPFKIDEMELQWSGFFSMFWSLKTNNWIEKCRDFNVSLSLSMRFEIFVGNFYITCCNSIIFHLQKSGEYTNLFLFHFYLSIQLTKKYDTQKPAIIIIIEHR